MRLRLSAVIKNGKYLYKINVNIFCTDKIRLSTY